MKAAIRHLMRNRGRSILTLLAVMIPVYMLVVMFGFAGANLGDMFNTATRLDTGHLQVRAIEKKGSGSALPLIRDPGPILGELGRIEGIEWHTVRLDLPALAGVGDRSQAIFVQGVVPEEVAPISAIGDQIVGGRYLTSGDDGVVIGEELAERLKLSVGDEMIVLGAHPETGLGVLKAPVVGIYRAPDAAIGRTIVQADLALARRLARSATAATAVVIRVEGVTGPWDVARIDEVADALRAALPADVEVVDWRTLAPMAYTYMRIMQPFFFIFAGIFFGLGALVVLNTLYLSVMERTRELGLVISLGASRWRVMRMILTEAGLLAVAGAIWGALAGVILVWIVEAVGGIPIPSGLGFAEIMRAAGISAEWHLRATASQVILAAVAMAGIAVLAAWYPAYRASKFEPVEAMRYVE